MKPSPIEIGLIFVAVLIAATMIVQGFSARAPWDAPSSATSTR